MDDFEREALRRLPLAEAALRLWAFITNESFLSSVFARHRGRSYEKVLSFPVMVNLIADALLRYRGSGRRSFSEAKEQGTLQASIVAAFAKLRRLPISLSMGFLADCTARLVALFPDDLTTVPLPASLAGMEPVVLDGKAIKQVAKRLKPLRGIGGGILGGRALVAMRLRLGLVVGMHVHPDGQVNDVRFVPDLVPQIRGLVPGTRIFLGDRQFCNLEHLPVYLMAGDHFLIRYHNNVTFTRDTDRPIRTGVDQEGRSYEQEWGWLGRPGHKQRRYLRRLTLYRVKQEPIGLVTDLEDADLFPATDLLALYLCRWGIERVFQQVTEVFGLEGLIGSSPEATLFQFAFCLVLYNILQVVRAYVAQGNDRRVSDVSTEQLFVDVQNQLIAWHEFVVPVETTRLIKPLALEETRGQLTKLLSNNWKGIWKKAPSQKRAPPPHTGQNRRHESAYRLLEEARAAAKFQHTRHQ
jgi:hypothetical protein